jgi:hypothetical protein
LKDVFGAPLTQWRASRPGLARLAVLVDADGGRGVARGSGAGRDRNAGRGDSAGRDGDARRDGGAGAGRATNVQGADIVIVVLVLGFVATALDILALGSVGVALDTLRRGRVSVVSPARIRIDRIRERAILWVVIDEGKAAREVPAIGIGFITIEVTPGMAIVEMRMAGDGCGVDVIGGGRRGHVGDVGGRTHVGDVGERRHGGWGIDHVSVLKTVLARVFGGRGPEHD